METHLLMASGRRNVDTGEMARWLLVTVLVLAGCGDTPSPHPSDDGPRIISLSPAITGTLEDAGLGRFLVGRSNWCRLRTRDDGEVPAVGDLHERDWEAILRVRPTHVFFQSADTGTDQALVDLSERNGWTLRSWPLRTVGEVQEMLAELPLAMAKASPELHQALTSRCEALSTGLSESMRPSEIALERRILVINDNLPPLAWGTETYLGEMLASAGGINVIGSGGWKTLSIEDVVRLEPDLVLVVTEQETDRLPAIASGSVAAIPASRCRWLVHPRINLPGPHLAEASYRMRDLLAAH